MSRFTEVNERYIAAWGKDHALGWFIDINPIAPKLAVGSIVQVGLEFETGWAIVEGELIEKGTNGWGKWQFKARQIITPYPHDESILVTLPDNSDEPIEIYEDMIEGYDPTRTYVVSKSGTFDGISARDVANILTEYGFAGEMLVQTRD
jgi:hypothetical protein